MTTAVAPNADAARRVFRRASGDWLWMVREVFGEVPWGVDGPNPTGQVAVLRAVERNARVGVASGHGCGKTKCAAWITACFLLTNVDSLVLTTAPTFRQVKQLLWPELRSIHANARFPLGGTLLTTQWELGEKWYALGFSTDDVHAVTGFHGRRVLVVVDEASGYPREIFDALEGALSGEGSKLLLIGNPTDPASIHGDAMLRDPTTAKVWINPFDSPNVVAGRNEIAGLVTRGWLEDKARRWGETSPLYLARCLGRFPELGLDTLVPLAWLETSVARYEGAPDVPDTGRRTLGVDVARFGDDETVVAFRAGRRARIVFTDRSRDTMTTTGNVVRLFQDLGTDEIRVDGVGVGGGVVDRLRELGYPVVDMQAGAAPSDAERFLNARAEWYWNLRTLFETNALDIARNDELEAQLSSIRYRVESSGKTKIEKKEDVKKRGLPSPDRADALMLACADASLRRNDRNFGVTS